MLPLMLRLALTTMAGNASGSHGAHLMNLAVLPVQDMVNYAVPQASQGRDDMAGESFFCRWHCGRAREAREYYRVGDAVWRQGKGRKVDSMILSVLVLNRLQQSFT